MLVCFASISTIISQTLQIDGIAGKRFNGVYNIISPEDGETAGYFTYHRTERGKKGMRSYEFIFTDTTLSSKTSTIIEMHKNARLNHTVFNGKFMLVSYEDWKNRVFVTQLIDKETGNIIKTKEETVDRKTYNSSTIFPAEKGEGFYIIKGDFVKKQGRGYELKKVDNNLEEIWSKTVQAEKGSKYIADLVNSNGRIILWQESNVKSKIKPSIVCRDASTGEVIYEREGYDGTSTILNNQIRIDEEGAVYLGGAYVDKERVDYINNDGIYVLKIDAEGNDEIYSKVPNKGKIQPVLRAASSGFTVGSKDKVYVQDLILDNGQIVVVTEMFRKNLNVTPVVAQATRDLITGKAIGYVGGYDDNKEKYVFEIMDFIVFKFGSTGNLDEIKLIEKDGYNKITVWYPYTYYGGVRLAKKMDQFGWFDYGFAAQNIDGKNIMVCKNNAKPRRPEVYTYTLDESFAQNKINLKQEAKIDLEEAKVGYFNIFRSSDGYFTAAYFQRKLDRITLNKESYL